MLAFVAGGRHPQRAKIVLASSADGANGEVVKRLERTKVMVGK